MCVLIIYTSHENYVLLGTPSVLNYKHSFSYSPILRKVSNEFYVLMFLK